MTETTTTPFQTPDERELHKQAYVECCVCLKHHPVDVTQEDGRLMLASDRVRYDQREGFMCRDCQLEILAPRETQGLRHERQADILDLLRAHPFGLTVADIADAFGRTTQSIRGHLDEMVICRTVTRHKAGHVAARYRALID